MSTFATVANMPDVVMDFLRDGYYEWDVYYFRKQDQIQKNSLEIKSAERSQGSYEWYTIEGKQLGFSRNFRTHKGTCLIDVEHPVTDAPCEKVLRAALTQKSGDASMRLI
jgi:hypothetical protein